MARRIAREVIEHWRQLPEQFGQKKRHVLAHTYEGCWVGYGTTGQDNVGQENVANLDMTAWFPGDVPNMGTGDYLVWKRYPDRKWQVDAGNPGLHIDRRGRLRAGVLPIKETT